MNIVQWLDDVFVDPFKSLYRSKHPIGRLFDVITVPIASVLGATGAISFLGVAFSSVGTWITTTFPFIAPILGGVGGSAFLASNPIGWGIAGILALPAIAGGFLEIGSRFNNALKGDRSVGAKFLSFCVAFCAMPLNFAYGFCRTAFHLATGRGYFGSVLTSIRSMDIDSIRETAAADAGGGSCVRGAVPEVVDRLVLGPALGIVAGFAASVSRSVEFFAEKTSGWPGPFKLLIGLPMGIIGVGVLSFANIPAGIWRGIFSGSQAAIDTFQYRGTAKPDNDKAKLHTNNNMEMVELSHIRRNASMIKAMGISKDTGLHPWKKGNTTQYDVAETFGEQAVALYKQKRADPAEKEGYERELNAKRGNVVHAVNNVPKKTN